MKRILLIFILLICSLMLYGQKIADLTRATTIASTDLLIIDATAVTSGITIANFFGTVPSNIITSGSLRALKTTEQFRLSYDAANYITATVLDDGHTTFTTVDEGVGVEADINFDPDGNVGIKTAAPSTALEVTGRVTASTGFTDGTVLIDGSGAFTGVADFTYGNGATMINTSADLFTITEATVDISGAFTATSMASDGAVSGTDITGSGTVQGADLIATNMATGATCTLASYDANGQFDSTETSLVGDITFADLDIDDLSVNNDITIDGYVIRSVTAGITAVDPGGQGDGPLTTDINEVSTVGTEDDAVTLPTAVAGLEIFIINNGANILEIWPASGDNLGAGANTATTLAAGANITFVSYDATNWETK